MVGLVVENDKSLNPGRFCEFGPLLPGGMAPTHLGRPGIVVFLVGIHGVIDQDIRALGELQQILI